MLRRFSLSMLAVVFAGCASAAPAPSAAPGVNVQSITVTSKAFAGSAMVPVDYTCDGKDVSPPLTWSSPPDATKSLLILVDDPDAQTVFTHWIAFDLPPTMTSISEGFDPSSVGGRTALNDFKNAQYNGPCPSKGELHRYRYHVVALDRVLAQPDGATHDAINRAMDGHIIGEGSISATFGH